MSRAAQLRANFGYRGGGALEGSEKKDQRRGKPEETSERLKMKGRVSLFLCFRDGPENMNHEIESKLKSHPLTKAVMAFRGRVSQPAPPNDTDVGRWEGSKCVTIMCTSVRKEP